MNKITTAQTSLSEKSVHIDVFELDENEQITPSRVYVMAQNTEGKVVLVYNSKRKQWGLPGGHCEFGESILDTAFREFEEEVGVKLAMCEPYFMLENTIESDVTEQQIICFGHVSQLVADNVDQNETVTSVINVERDKVLEYLTLQSLWKLILERFYTWSNEM